MKRFVWIVAACALFAVHAIAQEEDEEQSNAKPNPRSSAGGVTIDPAAGEISAGTEITISFPRAMVAPELIDVAGQPPPVVSEPPIDATVLWKSQTEGVLSVTSVVANARHHFHLAPGLKDASGEPFSVPQWQADFTAPKFTVTTDFEEKKHLSAEPQITLTFSYAVRLTEAAEHVYFQDRDSRQRIPAEVIQQNSDKNSAALDSKEFGVAPREPLPAGRMFDLIVNGLVEAKTRRPLPYLAVFSLGKTEPLKVEWVGALHHALEEPSIVIKFSDEIAPEQATTKTIDVQPAVADMRLLASGDDVTITGDFDLKQHYTVTISSELKGERGYSLPAQSRWGATFRPIDPSIVFPGSKIFARARQELRLAFFQANTPAVTWRLARIPAEKLAAVTKRVTEWEREALDPITGAAMIDPRTGFTKQFQTELLVDAFELPVIANANTDAASDDEPVRRDVTCAAPRGETLTGAYLFEANAKLPDGRVVGNRSIVCISDFLVTQKRTPTEVKVRVAKMSDAKPSAGVVVRAVTEENIELARATTDSNGSAAFARDAVLPAKSKQVHLFIADTPAGPALQFASGSSYSSGNDDAVVEPKTHVEIITDRNLYRPAQVVKMKGIARDISDRELAMPTRSAVRWRVMESESDRVVGDGSTTLNAYGAWETEWSVPENVKLGRYKIRCQIGGQDYDGDNTFSVEEYRVPLFSAVAEAEDEIGTTAHAHVSSVYFHGAPNVGARVHWKATWSVLAEISEKGSLHRYNNVPQVGPAIDLEKEETKSVEGDAQLDAHGFAELACDSPFKDNAAVERTNVLWRADITSADGQTLTGGATQNVDTSDMRLGVAALEATSGGAVQVTIDAVNPDNEPLRDVPVRAELFHVTTKTVKEQLAPFVYRYRNTDQFTKVATQETKAPAEFTMPASDTGRYVVAVAATKTKTPLVSDDAVVSGEARAELPVENEQTFETTHRAEPFTPGETAVLNTKAPFGGVAWVSVETDQMLDTLVVNLPGNAGRIELPVKKEYAPNATVAVYLVKPGGEKDLPLERFAFSEIAVRRPDRELKIESHLATTTAKPGENVAAEIVASSEGKPIVDADLVVFAVDDAVLTLGEWSMPDLARGFYRANRFGVRTYQSLTNYIADIAKMPLTQKGFTIGDGGEAAAANVTTVRKEFRTLAFWDANVRTDEHGKAHVEFVAPDNLTSYRLVALGQTKANQFGGDASQVVKISKPLLIDPALPRFVRDGDDLELRAVARQNFRDNEQIELRCVPDPRLQLTGSDRATQSAARDAPSVFRFKVHVADTDLAPVKVRFEAAAKSDGKLNDAVEVMIPALPPTIVRKESVAGQFTGPDFDPKRVMPDAWKRSRGRLNTTIATTPWLPKIAGLPVILEYPHGCFEQISTKLLGYSFLANLLAYLPDVQSRDAEYRSVLERGMKQFSESLLADGMLPYWPGGETGHGFVTCQALWAVHESIKAGFTAPEELETKLSAAVKKIVQGQTSAPQFDKAFALFVLAQVAPADDLNGPAHELYLRRDRASDEERALLALALHQLNIMPREQQQLVRELGAPAKERAFDPLTFASVTRADAMSALARIVASDKNVAADQKQRIRARLLELMESAASLSTQENLWLLLAFRALLGSEDAANLSTTTAGALVSKNGRAAAWANENIAEPLAIAGLNRAALSFLMQAEYSTDEVNTDRVDRGFRVERVVRNLTDAGRAGTAESPFKIGDQVLVTYRINTRKLQNYVALEDALPAGIEVVNPKLALVAKFFSLPPSGDNDRTLSLSHSELRDRATLLYFDTVEPGSTTYSVLARATSAGSFRWPATQVVPMYDSRFSGLSASSLCVVAGE